MCCSWVPLLGNCASICHAHMGTGKKERGPYKCLQISAGWVSGERGQILSSGAQRQDKGQWAQTEAEEVPAEHRMFRVGRDLCGSPSPTPCRSRVTQSRPHRTTSRQVWNISREGDSTASLGSLFQCSVTLRVKKFFLGFSWSFLGFSLCPLPLVLSLGTTGKSLAPAS